MTLAYMLQLLKIIVDLVKLYNCWFWLFHRLKIKIRSFLFAHYKQQVTRDLQKKFRKWHLSSFLFVKCHDFDFYLKNATSQPTCLCQKRHASKHVKGCRRVRLNRGLKHVAFDKGELVIFQTELKIMAFCKCLFNRNHP